MQADDRVQRAQGIMLAMGRLGQQLRSAIDESVGVDSSGNAAVLALVALDLRGSHRPGEIQELTGLTSGGTSKLLDRLELSGLVAREYGVIADDRRGAVVRLTPRGARAARHVARALLRNVAELRAAVHGLDAVLGGVVEAVPAHEVPSVEDGGPAQEAAPAHDRATELMGDPVPDGDPDTRA